MKLRRQINSVDYWLDIATRGLAAEPRARVRAEIRTHALSACEEATAGGETSEQAASAAVAALGDARAANRQYKKIHLTEWESKLMRQDECAARALHARPYLWFIPLLLICAAVATFTSTPNELTLVLLIGAAGLCFVFGAPYLIPINTRLRGSVYRALRLTWLVAIVALPCVADGSWTMLFSVGAPTFWMIGCLEWSRARARRKLPQAEWPRSLYL